MLRIGERGSATPFAAQIQAARRYFAEGAWSQAAQACAAILAREPGEPDALHLLGVIRLREGRPDQAEALLARAVQIDARRAGTWADRAFALIALGRFDSALADAARALQLDGQSAAAWLARANALLGAGRYDDSAAAYDQVLARVPDSAEAWANLGKARLLGGAPADALTSLTRAIALEPAAFAPHVNRGNAWMALDRPSDALLDYAHALALQPESALCRELRGHALYALGRDAEALLDHEAALRAEPARVGAALGAAAVLARFGRHAEALAYSEQALAFAPDDSAAWLTRGNAWSALGRHDDALDAFERVLARDPAHVDAAGNRAGTLIMLRRYPEALAAYDAALAHAPARADLWGARGNVQQELGRYDEATDSYTRSAQASPDAAPAWFHQGAALQQLGRHREALGAYEQALACDAAYGVARAAHALCTLLLGDFETGWTRFESRWDDPQAVRRRRLFSQPMWQGDAPLSGKTVLVHAEQGFGDTLQFCRYVTLLAAHGARVWIEAPAALRTLLGSLAGADEVFDTGAPLPPFDLHCPMLSLPLACARAGYRDSAPYAPAARGYLRADPAARDAWRARLDTQARPGAPRIGIVWSGNPAHANDHNRSLSWSTLAPLIDRVDAQWVSLQHPVRAADRAPLAGGGVLHADTAFADFADTAALIEALDLVIAVDTSVAHLAGALGAPLWVLLPSAPDWRWLLDRDDSPWYPGARLFRQPSPGNWGAVLDAVAAALATVRILH